MADDPHIVAGPGPTDVRDPAIRLEVKRAAVWLGMAAGMALVVLLIQPLLIIFGGLVFASMLDGGVRLLGRVLPIGRGWRLAIVVIATIAFITAVIYLTGVQVSDQFAQLRATLTVQAGRVTAWAAEHGLMPGRANINSIIEQAMGSFGRLTSWVGTAIDLSPEVTLRPRIAWHQPT